MTGDKTGLMYRHEFPRFVMSCLLGCPRSCACSPGQSCQRSLVIPPAFGFGVYLGQCGCPMPTGELILVIIELVLAS